MGIEPAVFAAVFAAVGFCEPGRIRGDIITEIHRNAVYVFLSVANGIVAGHLRGGKAFYFVIFSVNISTVYRADISAYGFVIITVCDCAVT